jgi:thiol-disulfide isomerase/thioredoxin
MDVYNKVVVDNLTGSAILIGKVNLEAFAMPEFKDWYNKEYNEYNPNKEIIDKLKDSIDDIKISIFLGTWCPDSRREVPRFIRILSEVNFDFNNLSIISLDRMKKSPGGEEIGLDIDYVPTMIFYNNGKEIGRIIESPSTTLEADMLKILKTTNK